MKRIERSYLDRRSGDDRRQVYDLDYYRNGGVERRNYKKPRRTLIERRAGWLRLNRWASVYMGA